MFRLFIFSVFFVSIFISCDKENKNDIINDSDNENEFVDEDNISENIKESFYDDYKVHEISIVMNEKDLEEMILQRRKYSDIFSGENCKESIPDVYTYFSADITINGETFKNSGIRKKGLIGSFSLVKPSVRIKLDEFEKDNSFHGIENLTLNNNKQDVSHIRQCLSYKIMRDAGIPAPKCNFAKVDINGRYLGIYTNVEPVGKSFLKNNFENYKGNLYEGTLADFRSDVLFRSRIEKKNNEEEDDWSDIEKLVEICASDDETFKNEIGKILDIDKFFKFWTAEVLTSHWDGYTGDINNWYIYFNQFSEKFEFIPWGTDGTFVDNFSENEPKSVYLRGIIARRFYSIPEYRAQYFDTLKTTIENNWNITEILNELETLKTSIEPFVDPLVKDFFSEDNEKLKDFINARKEILENEIAGEYPELTDDAPAVCSNPWGTAEISLKTTWGSYPTDDAFKTGTGKFSFHETGKDTVTAAATGGAAGTPDEAGKSDYTLIMPVAYFANEDIYILYITLPNKNVKSGAVIPLSNTESYLFMMPKGSKEFFMLTFIDSGELEFIDGNPVNGEPLSVIIKTELFF